MKEEWRDVAQFENSYQVSSDGRIRSKDYFYFRKTRWGGLAKIFKRGCILKIDRKISGAGYRCVCFSVNGVSHYRDVHRVVAMAFVDGYRPGMQVNHKNGNRLDNRASNLEWVTARDNIQNAKTRGSKFGKSQPADKNPNAKLSWMQVLKIRSSVKSKSALARQYGVSRSTIKNIQVCKTWKPQTPDTRCS